MRKNENPPRDLSLAGLCHPAIRASQYFRGKAAGAGRLDASDIGTIYDIAMTLHGAASLP
jgi:hypothetical protein